jgi:hypothetical protein
VPVWAPCEPKQVSLRQHGGTVYVSKVQSILSEVMQHTPTTWLQSTVFVGAHCGHQSHEKWAVTRD